MHVPRIKTRPIDTSEEAPQTFLVRQLSERDLPALIALDAKASGRSRAKFLTDKFAACVSQPGLNTSLAAENDGLLVAFLMGSVFFGEFGVPMSRAVLDVIGVQPEFRRAGAARALVSQYVKNMSALRVEALDTLVAWDRFDLLAFFKSLGFRPSRTVDLEWDLPSHPFLGRPGAVRVRPGVSSDLPQVSQIDAEQLPPPRTAYFAAKLEAAKQDSSRDMFLVADIAGKIAGFIVGSLFQGEFGIDETRGAVESIGVSEEHRGSGVASTLISELRDLAVKKGATRMETLCHWDQWELLRFFAYIGFRPSPRLNLELRINENSP
jgi:ribosomal protein S18 acetylase RimI-like enzyme